MKTLLIVASTLVTLALMGTEVMAQIRTVNLNTGYDQWSTPPQKIAVGQQDNEWRVIFDTTNQPPPSPPSTGRPADVVSDNTWGSVNFPNSRWISIKPNQGAPLPTPPNQFKYAFYFTLPAGFSSPLLTMKLSADDHITRVTLNSTILFQGSGGIFINPPMVLPTSPLTPSSFNSGPIVNVITVDVEDTAGGITGLIVEGAVTFQDCDRLPIREIPGLTSITFWESTFAAPTQHTFNKSDSKLINQISTLGPLNDFVGVPNAEFYDVFYSNWDGTVNPNGQFVTIEAVWTVGAPSGGGLNIAKVDFNGTGQFANSVASFVALGDNAMPNDVVKAVDGLASTDTTMGNTGGTPQRLRVTVGFPCCTSLPSGMVAWWPLDGLDPTGEYVDLMGGDNNGTPIGNPSQILSQHVGNSLQAATGKYVEVPDATNLNFQMGSFTIDAWVKFDPGTQTEPIVYKLASPSGGGYFLSIVTANTQGTQWKLQLQIATNVYAGPIITAAQGTWIFVAATVDKSSTNNLVNLYVGVPGSPFVAQSPPLQAGAFSASSPATPLWIGRWPDNPHATLGIDEVEIFNRSLYASEIQAIFEAGSAGKCKVSPNATVTGGVVDSRGRPVRGVEVQVPGRPPVRTNARGKFTLNKLAVTNRLAVSFSAPGFVNTTRVFPVRSGVSRVGNTVVIWPRAAPVALKSGKGGKVTFDQGGGLTIPPDSLVDKKGRPITGKVRVSLTYLDVSDPNQIRTAPGDFTALMQDGTVRTLESFGIFEVLVEDNTGRRAELATGKTAALELPVPRPKRGNTPRAVGLFSFEVASGQWIPAGSLVLSDDGLTYNGFVSQVNVSWNADDPVDTACIRVQVFEPHFPNPPHGPPAANCHVVATGVSYSGVSDGYTDTNGEICLLVKLNAQVTLEAVSTVDFTHRSVPIVITSPNIVAGTADCANVAKCPIVEVDLAIITGDGRTTQVKDTGVRNRQP
jgi:hypothetical protein